MTHVEYMQDTVVRYSLRHKPLRKGAAEKLLRDLGFKKCKKNEGFWNMKVTSGKYWREFKALPLQREIIFFVHREIEETSECYFEYLIKVGFTLGRAASDLERIPLVSKNDEDDEDTEDTVIEDPTLEGDGS
jgi:hypothetical protein